MNQLSDWAYEIAPFQRECTFIFLPLNVWTQSQSQMGQEKQWQHGINAGEVYQSSRIKKIKWILQKSNKLSPLNNNKGLCQFSPYYALCLSSSFSLLFHFCTLVGLLYSLKLFGKPMLFHSYWSRNVEGVLARKTASVELDTLLWMGLALPNCVVLWSSVSLFKNWG